MKTYLPLLILAMIFTSSFSSKTIKSERFESTPYQYEAIYLLNFSKYIFWPTSSERITVGVVGSPDVAVAIRKLAQKKASEGQTVEVINFTHIDQIKDCQMLFVSKDHIQQLSLISNKLRNTQTLLVAEGKDLCRSGACISLYSEGESKISFELNLDQIQAKGVKVSSTLVRMANTPKL